MDGSASIVRKVILPVYLLILSVGIPVYSLVFLPPIDFMDYNRGVDLRESNEFSIFNTEFREATDSLMAQDMTWFAVIAQEDLDKEDMENMISLYQMYEDGEIGLCTFTSNEIKGSEKVDTYLVDAVTLKSIFRSEKGVVLIDRGLVSGKWKIGDSVFSDLEVNEIEKLIKREDNIGTWYFLWIILFIIVGILLYYMDNRFKKIL